MRPAEALMVAAFMAIVAPALLWAYERTHDRIPAWVWLWISTLIIAGAIVFKAMAGRYGWD